MKFKLKYSQNSEELDWTEVGSRFCSSGSVVELGAALLPDTDGPHDKRWTLQQRVRFSL